MLLSSKAGHISAISSVQRIYRTASKTKPPGKYPEVLDRVLKIVTEAWGNEPKAVNGSIIEGVAQLVGRMGDLFKDDNLVSALRTILPEKLLSNGKQFKDVQNGSVPAAIASLLVGMHNKKRQKKNCLPQWRWNR